MPAVSSFMLAASLIGTGIGGVGMVKNIDAQKDMSAASKRAEEARRKQMQLNAAREQRKIFRDRQAAMAVGLSNITNAGAQDGSGMGGMVGQAMGAADQQSTDLGQNLAIGEEIFSANAAFSEAQGRSQTAQGLQQLGKDIFASAGAIGRVGNSIFGGPNVDRGIHDWSAGTTVVKA